MMDNDESSRANYESVVTMQYTGYLKKSLKNQVLAVNLKKCASAVLWSQNSCSSGTTIRDECQQAAQKH